MGKIILLVLLLSLLPSGIVAAVYLGKYLSLQLKLLNDARRRALDEEWNKFLK